VIRIEIIGRMHDIGAAWTLTRTLDRTGRSWLLQQVLTGPVLVFGPSFLEGIFYFCDKIGG
jgi:hypothetical protein